MADDPLRQAFDDVRAAAQTRVRRPGVDAARKTVRRRRTVRIVVAVVVLALLGGAGAVLHPWTRTGHPTPAASGTASPDTSPSATASPSPSPQTSADVVGAPTGPTCATDGWAILVGGNGSKLTLRFTPDGGPNSSGVLPCASLKVGIRLTTWYASNGAPSSGNAATLDSGHLTTTISISDVSRCVDWIATYSYTGGAPDQEIPMFLSPGSVDWGQTPPRANDGHFEDTRHGRSAIVAGGHNWGDCPTATPTP